MTTGEPITLHCGRSNMADYWLKQELGPMFSVTSNHERIA